MTLTDLKLLFRHPGLSFWTAATLLSSVLLAVVVSVPQLPDMPDSSTSRPAERAVVLNLRTELAELVTLARYDDEALSVRAGQLRQQVLVSAGRTSGEIADGYRTLAFELLTLSQLAASATVSGGAEAEGSPAVQPVEHRSVSAQLARVLQAGDQLVGLAWR